MLNRVALLTLPLFAATLTPAAETVKQIISLDSSWEFSQRADATGTLLKEKDSDWRPAEVPGCVHLDLLHNKLIPDPFYRDNEAKLQWIENADWEYRSTIDATTAMLGHRRIELVFEGLDTYAEVWLNDKQVLIADNMFREWRVDVKPYLKAGANTLRVVFPSPIRAAAKVAATDPWREKTHTAEKTYIRKAAYEYGWDWGPRFVTSGIWRPVRLELWEHARISNLYIHQLDVTAAVAHVLAEVEVTASGDETAEVSAGFAHDRSIGTAGRTVELHAGVNRIDIPLDVDKPERWYPAGYGAQPIYKFTASVRMAGHVEDQATAHTGLRSVVLRREPDQWGRSFEFLVNGTPVFGKGADVIPFDSFPTRVTAAQYRQVLQSARDANMNMIRHWGGGYYETQEFYDICDELGLMVWQDFMFGNDWQPGTYAFKQSVAAEAEDQVRRLRNHPSIVIWCGNNETEGSFRASAGLPPDVRRQMWEDYLTVFSGILPRVVERLASETPYWPSSPSEDYEAIPNFQSGDMHNWTVWHGRVPFSDYEKYTPRFMTEYGFQSFPEMRTVESFTTPEDRTSIFTPVMLAHQKNKEGNDIIHNYLLRYYTEPKDFASFLYVSQVLQAEGIKVGAEHLRRNRPHSMGSIYWQLNDCWPVASWSSLDYHGRWKALQYYARRFYNDLLVSPHEENGAMAVYVVSDRTAPASGELRARLMKFDGTVVSDKTQAIEIPGLSSGVYARVPNPPQAERADTFGIAELVVDGKLVSSNLLFFAPPKELHLPPAHVTAEWTGDGLRLSSNVLARSVYISFGDMDATLSNNYIDLLPGKPVDIRLASAAPADQLRANLKVVSLTDAFTK
jgi:beta-mannosidase